MADDMTPGDAPIEEGDPFADLRAYLEGPFGGMRGWCNPRLWQALQPIAEDMRAAGNPGPVAEIGVHYGKFFISLVKAIGGDGPHPGPHQAIDVFDMQALNLDRSGKGSLEGFRESLARTGVHEDRVRIRRADSMAIGPAEIAEIRADIAPLERPAEGEPGGISIFSVDGCHRVEHTVHDIETAMALTAPRGVILVDDYLNPNWPGVQEGVARLYLTSTPRFVPIVYIANKLFLAHLSHADRLREIVADRIETRFHATKMKRVPRFGYETLTLVPEAGSTDFLA